MKKILLIAALLVPIAAGAQEFAARTSVGADVKLAKGFHLGLEEEARFADGLSSLNNLRTTLDLSYKLNKNFKIGAGYTLINPYKLEYDDNGTLTDQGFSDVRHRLFVNATAQGRLGDFQLSLREKLQYTRRTDDDLNVYQTNPNALALKSRIGLKYKGSRSWEPFAYFEVRAALNDPWGEISGSVMQTNSGKKYFSYTHTGYTHAYVDRLRLNLGTDWSPTKHHTLTLNVLGDYCMDYNIDTNSPSNWAEKGVRLFSETTGWEDTFRVSLCIGYKFKF